MRQRVHSGRRSDRRRKRKRQLGIGEYGLREDRRRKNDPLLVRRILGNHRGAPNLAAGAGGRRQRDEMRQRFLDRPDLWMVPGVLEHVARMHGHQRDDLRDIERRSPAKSDHRVGAMGAIGIDLYAYPDLSVVCGDTIYHLVTGAGFVEQKTLIRFKGAKSKHKRCDDRQAPAALRHPCR